MVAVAALPVRLDAWETEAVPLLYQVCSCHAVPGDAEQLGRVGDQHDRLQPGSGCHALGFLKISTCSSESW